MNGITLYLWLVLGSLTLCWYIDNPDDERTQATMASMMEALIAIDIARTRDRIRQLL